MTRSITRTLILFGIAAAVFTANADQLLNVTNGEVQIDIIGYSLV